MIVVRRILTAACCLFVFVCLVSVSAVPQEALAAAPVPGWEDAVMLESMNAGSFDMGSSYVAADASGNAFVVWDQYDGSRNCVFASRYVHGVGWTVAQLIDSAGVDSCYNPRVAFDGNGNAVAVWQQLVSWVSSVWANRYVVGEGWGTPEPIESQAEEAGLPKVVVDESGNATVLWEQYLSGHGHVWSNRYVVGEGWGVEEEAEQFAEDAYNFDVTIDGSGCVVAVWSQWDGSHYNVSTNRFVPGEGWGTAEMICGNASGDASEPKVAVDSSGNATAVWSQYEISQGLYSIWSNRYEVGEGWGSAVLLELDDSEDAFGVRVADDGSGTAMAVWHQDDAGVNSIWSSLYILGEGWGPPETVEDGGLYAAIPRVVMDWSGNGTALWLQFDGVRNTISSSRYVTGEGWGEMELVSTVENWGCSDMSAAVDGLGNVFAAWLQDDSIRYNLWANVYICPDTTPPVISIASPADGLTVETPAVTVSGVTEPGASLDVNGMSAVVEADGSFSCVVILVNGTNTITATVTDLWGNSADASVNVTFVDPVAALEAQLAAALDELAALQDELDLALAEAAALQDDLDDANADVATLQAQLDTALALLVSMQTQLDAAEADLVEAQEALEAATGDVESLEAELDTALANLTLAQADLDDALDELDSVREELDAASGDVDCASSFNILLMAALAVAAVVAAVMAVMYIRARGRAGPEA